MPESLVTIPESSNPRPRNRPVTIAGISGHDHRNTHGRIRRRGAQVWRMRSPTLVESPEPSCSTTPEPSSSSVMSSVPASTAGTRSYWGWQTAMGLFPGYAVHTGPAPRVKSSASTDTSSAASSFPWRQACAQPGWFWMWQRPTDTSVPGLTRWPMPVSMARLESVPSGAWSSSAIICCSYPPGRRSSLQRRAHRRPYRSRACSTRCRCIRPCWRWQHEPSA